MVILVGIFIILLVMFNCFFLGFFFNCIKGIFGVISRFFNGVRFNLGGFLGKLNLFIKEYGGIFFFFKYL